MSDGERADPTPSGQGTSPLPEPGGVDVSVRRSTTTKWVVIAAVASAVAVLAGVGVFVLSGDDTDDSDDGAQTAGDRGAQEGGGEVFPGGFVGDADVIVFLDRGASADDRAAIEATLDEQPGVEEFDYLDEEESAEAFAQLFEDNEVMLDQLEQNADLVPTSYHVILSSTDSETIDEVVTSVEQLDGVLRAESVGEALATLP